MVRWKSNTYYGREKPKKRVVLFVKMRVRWNLIADYGQEKQKMYCFVCKMVGYLFVNDGSMEIER